MPRLTNNSRKRWALQAQISAGMERAALMELGRLWRGVRRKLGRLHRLRKYQLYSHDLYSDFQDRLQERLLDLLEQGMISMVELEFALGQIPQAVPFEYIYEDALAQVVPTLALRITQVTQAIKRRVARRVKEWYNTPGQTMQEIINDLQPQFGIRRAELIAQTEITRMHSGMQESVAATLAIEDWWWQTKRDHLVCVKPIVGPDGNTYAGCRELHGKRFKIGMRMPPDGSHPGCRCDAVLIIPPMAKFAKSDLLKAWEEGKHPRAKDGRFGEKAGAHEGAGDRDAAGAVLRKPSTFTPEILAAIEPHYHKSMREVSSFAKDAGVPAGTVLRAYEDAKKGTDNRYEAYQAFLRAMRPEIAKAGGDAAAFTKLQSRHRVAGLRLIAGLKLEPKPVSVKKPEPAPKPEAKPKKEKAEPKPKKGVYTPMKSEEEVKKFWKKSFGIRVDFAETDLNLINEWGSALSEALNDHPIVALKMHQGGSMQGRLNYEKRNYAQRMLLQNKVAWEKAGYSESEQQEQAEILARKHYVHQNTYAYSSPGKGIFLNADYSAADMNSKCRRDVRTGFHPEGCGSVKGIVDHEVGHQLDDLLRVHRHPAIKKLWKNKDKGTGVKNGLSGYAEKDIYEMIAEGWSEYRNNPTPRPMAKEIGDVIVELYAAREKAMFPPKAAPTGSTKER